MTAPRPLVLAGVVLRLAGRLASIVNLSSGQAPAKGNELSFYQILAIFKALFGIRQPQIRQSVKGALAHCGAVAQVRC